MGNTRAHDYLNQLKNCLWGPMRVMPVMPVMGARRLAGRVASKYYNYPRRKANESIRKT